MIFGIGTDIVDIRRIERMMVLHKNHFMERVFTKAEQEYCLKSTKPAHRFAKRFAAKEAFFKALGSGLSDGMSWVDVEVVNFKNNYKPELNITGKALTKMQEICGSRKVFVSLSDDYPYAIAYVIIE